MRDFIKSIDQVGLDCVVLCPTIVPVSAGATAFVALDPKGAHPARQESLKWVLEQFGLKKPRPGLGAMAGATSQPSLAMLPCSVDEKRSGFSSTDPGHRVQLKSVSFWAYYRSPIIRPAQPQIL